MSKLSIGEITRRLYKKNYADNQEYKQALNALSKLLPSEQEQVSKLASQYWQDPQIKD